MADRRWGRRGIALGVVVALAVPFAARRSGGRVFPVGPATPSFSIIRPADTISTAEFADPPMWARPQAYWLTSGSEDPATLKAQLDSFKALGMGGVTFEPNGVSEGVEIAGPHVPVVPEPTYTHLSPAWFAEMDDLLQHAEDIGMTMVLPDVGFTPSGSARGRVAEPQYGGDPALGWTTLVENVPSVKYTPVTRPYWIDPLNPAAVQKYIDVDYALHDQYLGHHFGKSLQALWSDEVSFQPTVSPETFARPVRGFPELPWSSTFPDYFEARAGYEFTPDKLFHVFHPNPDDPVGRKYVYDYWDAVSARFADVYYGGLSRWSTDHGVGFIGQLLAEETTEQRFVTEGSYFRAQAYPTMASTDFISGILDMAGGPNCDGDGCYGLTTKSISSAAHLFDRQRVHMEFLDLANAEIKDRPAMLRAMIDHVISRGANLLAFHSYDQGGGGYHYNNMLWDYEHNWIDYTARLQYLFSAGQSLPDIAIGDAPEAFWVGDTQDTNVVAFTSGALRSAHYEYDHVPVELLEDPATSVTGGVLSYGPQHYRALVVPDWSTASLAAVQRAADFVNGGGTIAAVGRLPVWETGGNDPALKAAVTALFGFDPTAPPSTVTTHASGAGAAIWMPGDFTARTDGMAADRADDLAGLVNALRERVAPRVAIEGEPLLPSGFSAVETLPWKRAGADQYLVTNFPSWQPKEPGHGTYLSDFVGQPADLTVVVPATGVPELWDAETGAVTPITRYEVADGKLRIPLHLPPFGSAVVRLAPGDPAAVAHITATNLLDAALRDGRVHGYAPVGLTAPAFADVTTGTTTTHFEVAAPAASVTPLDPVYTVTWSEGGSEQRRAGSWFETSLDPVSPRRSPYNTSSGTYTADVDLPTPPAGGRVILDLGRVGDISDASVNGAPLGTRMWPPYAYDVTGVVHAGPDGLSILVKPSEAMKFPTGDTRWPSGILGPVTVRVEPFVDLGAVS